MNKDNKKTIVEIAGIGTAAAVVGGLGYYYLTQVTGAVGGSCSTKGTPCNTAIAPYQKAWASCFAGWNILNNATLKQGYATSAQTTQLANYQQCMDYNAAQITKTVASYKPTNPMAEFAAVFAPYIQEGVLIVGGVYALTALGKFVLKSRGNMYMSNRAMQSASEQSGIQGEAVSGKLTPQEASNAEDAINQQASTISDLQAQVAEQMQAVADELNLNAEFTQQAIEDVNSEIVSEAAMTDTADVLAEAAVVA